MSVEGGDVCTVRGMARMAAEGGEGMKGKEGRSGGERRRGKRCGVERERMEGEGERTSANVL